MGWSGRILCVVGLCFACVVSARGQANVNEKLETVFVWVDVVNGADSNPGTQSRPFQTLRKAVLVAENNNRNSIGTRVTINPGTYREAVFLVGTPSDTNLPITFEAATNGTVIISGADVFTGWTQYTQNPNIYTTAWPYEWGLCPRAGGGAPFEQDIVLRREMIFVDGAMLTEVLALDQMVEGTFFPDETSGTVYIWPPAGTDVPDATIEVSTRPNLFFIFNKQSVVLRGLTVQYANSCRSDHAALVYGASNNILFDTDSFSWNGGSALNLLVPTTNFTVQNTVANHNGQLGFADFQTKFGLWQNDTADYNNWRGSQGAYYNWGNAGAYPYSEHNVTYNGFSANFNQATGMHFDTDNAAVTLTSVTASNNLLDGVFVEKNEGPMTFSSSTFCNNGTNAAGALLGLSGGFELRNSEMVTLNNSTLYNNYVAQINIQGSPGGIGIINWETLQPYNLVTQNFTNNNNVLDAALQTQQTFADNYLGGTDWIMFQSTFLSGNNTWWNPANSTTPFGLPVPVGGTFVDFPGWQLATLQDLLSTFSAPLVDPATACALTPDAPDFWLISNNASLSTDAAGSAVFGLSVVPVGNFVGTVNLTYGGVNEVPGLSATLSPATIVSGGISTLGINAAVSTVPGTYPITVIANSGSITRTSTFSLVVTPGSVRFSPGSMNFAAQQINTTSPPQVLTMTNQGATTISGIAITVVNASSGWAQTSNCGSTLAPGTSCTINVTFTPFAVQLLTGAISVSDSDPSSPQIINLTGTGTPAPVASVSPQTLTFGAVVYGITSAPQTIALTNSGSVPLIFSSIAITGANPGDFAQTNDCGSSLPANSSCTFTVTFSPLAVGTRNASITIVDNAAGSGMQNPALFGSGVAAVNLTPPNVGFGAHNIGQTSGTQTITLINSGHDLPITSITLGGPNVGDFSESTTCGGAVLAGGSCTFSVSFTPTAAGSRAATITIVDTDISSPQVVNLTGSGTAVPQLTLSAHFQALGKQVFGLTSHSMTVTATNTGTGPVNISQISVGGNNPGDFGNIQNCGSTLAVGASCTLTNNFTPSALGARSAQITVSDDAGQGSQSVILNGTGTSSVSLSPGTTNFGAHNIGTTSSTRTVTLSDLGRHLAISSITLGGVNPGDFAQTNTCGTGVHGGGNCTFSVTFTPTAAGARSATITLLDSDPSSPQVINLSGTGTGVPILSLSPGSLTFGNQVFGLASAAQVVTATNTGTGVVNISGVKVSGANGADFAQTGTCGATLAVGANCTISVTFTPKALGARSAQVTVSDNAGNGSQTAVLTGTGVTSITLSPALFSFGSHKVGKTSSPQTATLTNNGNRLTITKVVLGGANAADFAMINTCGNGLATGKSCTIHATFTPTAKGSRAATITLTDSDPTSPQIIVLSGTGT